MKKILLAAIVALMALPAGSARANYAYRDGNGTLQQIFSFICENTVICPGQVQIDSSGTEKATVSNPATVGGSYNGSSVPISVDSHGNVNVNASVSATVGGFTPSASGARGTPFSVLNGTDSSGLLPVGSVVVVSNPGSNDMFCNVNGQAASSADQLITAGGGWFAFTIPSGVTFLHCSGDSGSTTANMLGGSGIATGTGGGSGGGGSGGIVDQGTAGSSTSAWFVAPGSGATFPVSGTFWPYSLNGDVGVPSHITNFPTTQAVTQSGSWTVGQSGSPWGINLTQLAGSALGTPSNYGTSPGAVSVQGVNAFITNSPSVAQSGSWTVAATESGTWTVQPGNTANSTPWLFTISQGGNAAAVNGSGQLSVNCANCSGSGVAQQDATGYTQGTTDFVPIGGIYTTSVSNLTTGQAGAAQLTTDRMLYTNLGKWGGTAVGAPTAWGTAPSGNVVGFNGNILVSVPEGTTADAPCSLPATTTACSLTALAKATANQFANPLPAQSNNTTTVGQVGGQVNITPTSCSTTITTGGTAQNIIAANAALHGFSIANIDASAGSGEPIWIAFTTTAVAGAVDSYPLAAPTATTYTGLSSYSTPFGFGSNHAVSVIGATTGHKISCTYW